MCDRHRERERERERNTTVQIFKLRSCETAASRHGGNVIFLIFQYAQHASEILFCVIVLLLPLAAPGGEIYQLGKGVKFFQVKCLLFYFVASNFPMISWLTWFRDFRDANDSAVCGSNYIPKSNSVVLVIVQCKTGKTSNDVSNLCDVNTAECRTLCVNYGAMLKSDV